MDDWHILIYRGVGGIAKCSAKGTGTSSARKTAQCAVFSGSSARKTLQWRVFSENGSADPRRWGRQAQKNREQEKPRTERYSQDKTYVPARKRCTEFKAPCSGGACAAIHSNRQENRWRPRGRRYNTNDFDVFAAAAIPVPCSLFPRLPDKSEFAVTNGALKNLLRCASPPLQPTT